jgi:hypothetical protein
MKELFNHILLHKVTPNQLFLMHCIRTKTAASTLDVNVEAPPLIKNGWLTPTFKLTQKAEDLLNYGESLFTKVKKMVSASVLGADGTQKIEEWRKIWPPGRPARHGKLISTNVKELEQKFIWFFNNYPQFNWDMVMAATQFYVDDQRLQGYEYIQVSKYFVCKHDILTREVKSDLASYCDDLKPVNQIQMIAA